MSTASVKSVGSASPSAMDHINGLASKLNSTLSTMKKGGRGRKRGGNSMMKYPGMNTTMKHKGGRGRKRGGNSMKYKGGSRKRRGGLTSTSSYAPSMSETSTPFSNSKTATMSGGRRRRRRY